MSTEILWCDGIFLKSGSNSSQCHIFISKLILCCFSFCLWPFYQATGHISVSVALFLPGSIQTVGVCPTTSLPSKQTRNGGRKSSSGKAVDPVENLGHWGKGRKGKGWQIDKGGVTCCWMSCGASWFYSAAWQGVYSLRSELKCLLP